MPPALRMRGDCPTRAKGVDKGGCCQAANNGGRWFHTVYINEVTGVPPAVGVIEGLGGLVEGATVKI